MPLNNNFFIDFDNATSKYDSEGRPLTKEQARFFVNSQCVDNNKRLLVVYHVSTAEFTAFDPARIGSGNGSLYGKSFYFSSDRFSVDIYGSHVGEYYLNLKHPFRWEPIDEEADATYNLDMFIEVLQANNYTVSEELRAQLEDQLLNGDALLADIITMTCGPENSTAYFMKAGYDGIMDLDVGDYAAFLPQQIKLCSNKNPTSSSDAAT